MQPIINPIWFYLIELVTTVSTLLIIIPIFVGALILMTTYIHNDNLTDVEWDKYKNKNITEIEYYEYKFKLAKEYNTTIIKVVSTIAVCFTLSLLIPSSSTLTKMLISSQITVDRVDKSVEVVEKVYNDILNRIDKTNQ